MAILAASICTHGGKVLVSRQFRDLSKDKITALLANFPSLLSSSGSQNTTVEDDAVRYVYQPLEEYYVVLVTNKSSNILQDIDTLHLFVSVVSNTLRAVDEKEITANAFEILCAFDEIVTLGYREKLTMSQVQTFLEMDSHEEKIQEIIERNKEMEATEERRRRAKEIQRKELARRNMESQAAAFGSAPSQDFGASYNSAPAPTYTAPQPEPVAEYAAPRTAGKGLQLGKKPAKPVKQDHQPLLAQLSQPPVQSPQAQTQAQAQSQVHPAHGVHNPHLGASTQSASASPAPQQVGDKPLNDGILITVNEKVSAELTRDGNVESAEVKGDLSLRISDASLARAKILLNVGNRPGIQYKTHPNVDRGLFSSDACIGLKDKTKPFPSNDQSLGVLRWRATAKDGDASLLPLLFTAWVSVNDGAADVTLEYELTSDYLESHPTQDSLDNIQVLVPIASEDVILKEDSTGYVSYEVTAEGVLFSLQKIELGEPSGSFEFSIPAESEDSLFPMSVGVDYSRTEGITESDVCFGQVSVIDVVSNDDKEDSLPFTMHSNLTSEGYTVN